MLNQEEQEIELVQKILESVNILFSSLNGKELSGSTANSIKYLTDSIDLYNSPTLQPSLKNQVISNIASHALNINSILGEDIKSENSKTIARITELSQELTSLINNRKTIFNISPKGIAPPEANENPSNDENLARSLSRIKQEIASIRDDYEKHDERHKKLISENLISIEKISEATKNLEDDVSIEIKKAQELYTRAADDFREKEEQINRLVGTISGTAIAGSYEKSSEQEKSAADTLRFASIFCMFVIVCIVTYSFWETTTDAFKWENSIFRIILALILSVPSAYLARESSKHRLQQYSHLQTSLDLKAINPFIATLPAEEQNKLKAEIANRIFSPKDISNIGTDSYPINAQELILELIKKIKPKE